MTCPLALQIPRFTFQALQTKAREPYVEPLPAIAVACAVLALLSSQSLASVCVLVAC